MPLATERLTLNDFNLDEGERVAQMAGDRRVFEMTSGIPHPYEPLQATEWISGHAVQAKKHNYIFAIRLKENQQLIGCVNVAVNRRHDSGCLGYWIGPEHWGRGYGTEAVRRVIQFAFEEKFVNKVWAQHKAKNIASGRLMEKCGMKTEGIMREHFKGEDSFEDLVFKSILKSEYHFENSERQIKNRTQLCR
jgi:RimJ/RimL family protein N-acetyltransferase